VSSRNSERASEFARKNAIPNLFDDPADLINSTDVDAIYVATPPSSHARFALMAAAAGKPCCVEKPMAMSADEASTMVAAFEDARQPLFVSYYRRSLPRFRRVKEWIGRGEIGFVRHVHWSLIRPPRTEDVEGRGGWRTSVSEAPGGYFDDLACHGLDLLDYLIGPITECSGLHVNQQQYYSAPDAVAASWRHGNGATGSGCWNFAGYTRVDELSIYGSTGVIRLSVFEDSPFILESTSNFLRIEIDNPDPVQLFHVKEIMHHLTGQSVHPAQGKDAMRTAIVMDQILGRTSQRGD
jgi:predicted dehydrogenase